jgi:hypothetical protein
LNKIRINQAFVHHVEMHEFWLWCGFKSLKNIGEKVGKFCEKDLI